jgi:ribosomal protein RSM22 (predicted rRNA methylase)
VAKEVELLSAAYRGAQSRAARTPAQVAAYLAYRAPATFAAAASVFRQVARQQPEWRPQSLLDVGAGPGVAVWAAVEQWPSLTELALVEIEPAMIAAGRELLPDANWMEGDATSARGPADLVVASYVLGELDEAGTAARHLWEQASDAVVVIEPGTPVGYRNVLAARAAMLERGGHTIAPCPHNLPCPLRPDDWCHFAVRLPRSRLHRQAKGVELGYEDEKFSYAALSRASVPRAEARVIRQPQVRSGHVNLVTCELDGIHERTISRRQGPLYRDARKAAWGDAIALAPERRP